MPAYKNNERGKWECSFYYEDWTGKRRQKHKRGFGSKKEAREYEREFILKAKANMDMKLESFVDIYFDDKESELKEQSLRNKRYMMNVHIIPYLGQKSMNEITPSDIIAWQKEIISKNDYSASYLRMIQNHMTALFTHACTIYGLSNNPCKKVKKMGKSDDSNMDFWTYEEYESFIETFNKKSMHYVMFEILFWTGCREGEMLALSKRNIDKRAKKMYIEKTYYRLNKQDIITTPKTENSVRTIDLPKFLVDEISEYEDRLYNYPEDERLFPVTDRAVQKIMKEHSKKAGVKEIRVHDLRHSHVAYLSHQGVETLIIKERLGHKDIKITLNTYGHLYPNEQERIAKMLDVLNG